MVHHVYSVVATGGGWAVRHLEKQLAVHPTRAEAEAHVERLARLTQVSGHDADVIVKSAGGAVQSDEVYRRIEK
jgi:hypothetical protein